MILGKTYRASAWAQNSPMIRDPQCGTVKDWILHSSVVVAKLVILPNLGGGFKYFLFSTLPGEMIHFDKYFSNGLKPPARNELTPLNSRISILFFLHTEAKHQEEPFGQWWEMIL